MPNSVTKPMRKAVVAVLSSTIALAGCVHELGSKDEESRWVELFDGHSLEGWTQVNGLAPYSVEGDAIRGTNIFDTPNSFLATNDAYSDFVLEFESRSIGDANSGVQFRTDLAPGTWSGVIGYQLDIDPTARRWTGGIYHEGAHVWRHSMARNPDCQAAYKYGAWNRYRIEAVGPVMATWVNDVACAHMVGDHHAAGVIALQIHDIGQEEKYRGSFTEWRKIRVLENPDPSDLWQHQRAGLIEGWLDDTVSEIERDYGWYPIDFADGAENIEMGPIGIEVVVDVQLDDTADGYLGYALSSEDSDCVGRYKIYNDDSAGEGIPKTEMMGSFPGEYAATNLSEPGRPKRAYGTERWNRIRIVATADRIQHWLNSVKVVEYRACDGVSDAESLKHIRLDLVAVHGEIKTRSAKIRSLKKYAQRRR
ncbi:MAG: DUF1080 domain-containing protein [Pseudomonadota bacterium]